MAILLSVAADAWLTGTAGGAGAVGTGAYTIAVLIRPAAGNNNFGMAQGRTASVAVRSLLEDSLHLFGDADFSSGDAATLTQGTWYVAAQSKAGGSATYRHHLWAYASDGSGTMSHAVSSGSSAQPDGSAVTELRIGNAGDRGNGDIAVAAFWTSALSDAQLDALKSGSLAAWAAQSPAELITFEGWNGTTGWSTKVGTSSLSSITGTVSVGTDPPGFSFATSTTPDPLYIPPRPPGFFAPNGVLLPIQGAEEPASAATNAGAEAATATCAASDITAAVGASPAEATSTGAASDASIDVRPGADVATATGLASDGQADVRVNAESTAASGSAPDPTVATSGNTNAPAESTSATGSAADATVSVSASAETSTATAAASAPQAGVTAQPPQAAGTGLASDAAADVQANAVAALATGVASDAGVSTTSNVTADAGPATGTAAAGDATITVTATAESASGTGAANTPQASTGPAAAAATGSASAPDVVITLAVNTEVATAVGDAYPATVVTGGPGNALAEPAMGSGAAYNAKTRRMIPRPAAGTTARPGTGTTARPYSGAIIRP